MVSDLIMIGIIANVG